VMSRSKCPAFLGSMSQHPAKDTAQGPMQEQPFVWAVSFLTKAVECLIDTGPAWPSSVHRSIRSSRALRFARGRRLQDACSMALLLAGQLLCWSLECVMCMPMPLLILNTA
jgi:hypothetical protein